MSKAGLTITDNRTGKSYEVPIFYGTYPTYGAAIRAEELRKIKVSAEDFGLMCYDPASGNTASCRSQITFIDGERGILRYRGYPIEQLAEQSTYLETAYLILHGELPTRRELDLWVREITHHTMIHESIKKFLDGFHYDAHPMGMLIGTVGALSTFYPEAKSIQDPACRRKQIARLIAKMPTLAAFAFRHSLGMAYSYPDNDLSYAGNFLNMLFKTTELRYKPDPALGRALDVLFILHADHEQNCSANTMRCIGSSHPDPYSALAGAAAALYGPLHGGANEQVLRMLAEIGSRDKVPAFIERVKAGEGRLMGFGHRVYKNYDPRARIIKKIADEVFAVTGTNPLLEIALELAGRGGGADGGGGAQGQEADCPVLGLPGGRVRAQGHLFRRPGEARRPGDGGDHGGNPHRGGEGPGPALRRRSAPEHRRAEALSPGMREEVA
jgi:citrate synthase